MNNVIIQKKCAFCNSPIQNSQAKIYCSILCRNRALSQRKPKTKGRFCKACGSYGYDRKYDVCKSCKSELSQAELEQFGLTKSIHVWSEQDIDFLKKEYPNKGADYVSKKMNLSLKTVRARANALGIKLSKKATKKIVNAKAKDYMIFHNPMKNKSVASKVSRWWETHPNEKEKRDANLLIGRQKLQKNKPNKLEKKAHRILKSLGINFEKYVIIKPNFIVDIRIDKTIVQIDGEYWHGHPRFDPLTERQLQQRKRDKAQDKYLTACGYRVIRIWERDVTTEYISVILRDCLPISNV